MSGGHFDYGCFRISQFADELQHEIDTIHDRDEWGNCWSDEIDEETLERLKEAKRIIRTAGRIAKQVEWLFSGDTGAETFNELFDEIMSASRLTDGP